MAILGAGDPVLLLHGLTASRVTWRRVIPLLARRFTVLAPDLPGRGRSPARQGLRYRLRDEVDRIRQLLHRLGLERVTLAGHSQGAAVGLALAATGREVSGLVMINPVTPWTTRPPALAAMDLLPLQAFAAASRLIPPMADSATSWILRERVFTGEASPTAEDVEAFARPHRDPDRAAALPSILADWNPAALRGYLPREPVRGVVLAGECDRRVPPGQVRRLGEVLDFPWRLIAGAGHALPLERPERVARAIRETAG